MPMQRDRYTRSVRVVRSIDFEPAVDPLLRDKAALEAEKADPRRGRTEYIRSLEADIRSREESDTLLEGTERKNKDGLSDAEMEELRLRDGEVPDPGQIPAVPVDEVTSSCLNVVHREENEMTTATMDKPKAVKKASKPQPKKAARPKSAKKAPKASKKPKKKGGIREQTCVNIFIPVKKKAEAWVKKEQSKGEKISLNRLVNELLAKHLGVKIAPRRAAS